MKKIFAGILVSLACVSGWAAPVSYGGHYYDFVTAPKITWDDARIAALSSYYLGFEGHLATITSAGEDSAVGSIIFGGEAWAGGYQNPITETDKQAGWTWVNGEGSFPGVSSASPYANWNNGEPNDGYGAGSEQHLGLNLGNPGGFNDEGNLDYIVGYVIEWDPNTIPDVSVPDVASTAGMLSGALVMLGILTRRIRK